MRHKLCRSFHPWCPGVKNRCLWLLVVGVTFPLVFQADISVEPTLMWPLPWPCTMTLVLYGVIGRSGLQMWEWIFFSFRRSNVLQGQCIIVVTSVGQQPLFTEPSVSAHNAVPWMSQDAFKLIDGLLQDCGISTVCRQWKYYILLVYCCHIEGILPKGPYLPCVSMAGRALLAGYHRYIWSDNAHSTTIAMIKLQSDLHSLATPHTSLSWVSYGVSFMSYMKKNDGDISREHCATVSHKWAITCGLDENIND